MTAEEIKEVKRKAQLVYNAYLSQGVKIAKERKELYLQRNLKSDLIPTIKPKSLDTNFQTLEQVRQLALELIGKDWTVKDRYLQTQTVNLKSKGYTFRFDKATRRFGRCTWGRKREISLSKPLCLMNLQNGAKIKDTILHEIAHGIDAMLHGRSSHDATWKRIAKSIGSNGNRCYSANEVIAVPGKYVYTCPNGHVSNRQKRLKRETSCGQCSRKFDRRYLLTLT